MTGEFQSAADIVTGSWVSRVVEPNTGADPDHAPTSANCLNCGTPLTGQFCHTCGQNGHLHNTVGAIGHDLLHGVLHLEGKTWQTLPMLAFKPGELTRRYIAGERTRFVSPMAIFLFSVFLMFAVVAQLPGWKLDSDLFKPGVIDGMIQTRTNLAEQKGRATQAISENQARLAKERADPQPDAERIARLEKRIADATKARDGLALAEKNIVVGGDLAAAAAKPATPQAGENWFEAKLRHLKENPQLLIYKIKTSAYKYSWALIPISLPFIWLLFPLRRDVGMYDHAIFATYSLAFMSLLTIVLAVLVAIGLPEWIAWTAAVFIPPFHIYKQLKYGYNLGRIGALWRTFLMLNFAIFTLTFFAMFLLWIGLAD